MYLVTVAQKVEQVVQKPKGSVVEILLHPSHFGNHVLSVCPRVDYSVNEQWLQCKAILVY